MHIGNDEDAYQEAIDIIEEIERGNIIKGNSGFTSISKSDPEYVRTVIEEIQMRGYKVRQVDECYISIEKQKAKDIKLNDDDEER